MESLALFVTHNFIYNTLDKKHKNRTLSLKLPLRFGQLLWRSSPVSNIRWLPFVWSNKDFSDAELRQRKKIHRIISVITLLTAMAFFIFWNATSTAQ